MTKDKFLLLIHESRQLIKHASPEQRIRLLKLIKESYIKLKNGDSEKLPWILIEGEQQDDLADAETNRLMNYAKQHYPDSPTRQQAFFKYITRALKHSEQDDKSQNKELGKLEADVLNLQKEVAKLKLSESSDYLEEK